MPFVVPNRTRRNPNVRATAGNADVKAARVAPNQLSLEIDLRTGKRGLM